MDWMSRLPGPLLQTPLWDLAIPGSHDSMSFCLDMSSPMLRSEPALLRLLNHLLPCCVRPCVQGWSTTQRSVLSDQCDLGVRFLDLRIARKPTGGAPLLFAHGVYTLISVKEQPSLSSCWIQGQQLLVSYDEEQVVKEHPQLWPSIPYWYADSPDPEKVIRYLDERLSEGRPDHFFVSGLNLTEDLPFVLLHPLLNLQSLTLKGLPPLLRWTNQQWPGAQRGGVNILCSDFVGLSQFCSIVIGLNYKLLDST